MMTRKPTLNEMHRRTRDSKPGPARMTRQEQIREIFSRPAAMPKPEYDFISDLVNDEFVDACDSGVDQEN